MFLIENNNENSKQLIKKRNYEPEQSKKEDKKHNKFLNRILRKVQAGGVKFDQKSRSIHS